MALELKEELNLLEKATTKEKEDVLNPLKKKLKDVEKKINKIEEHIAKGEDLQLQKNAGLTHFGEAIAIGGDNVTALKAKQGDYGIDGAREKATEIKNRFEGEMLEIEEEMKKFEQDIAQTFEQRKRDLIDRANKGETADNPAEIIKPIRKETKEIKQEVKQDIKKIEKKYRKVRILKKNIPYSKMFKIRARARKKQIR